MRSVSSEAGPLTSATMMACTGGTAGAAVCGEGPKSYCDMGWPLLAQADSSSDIAASSASVAADAVVPEAVVPETVVPETDGIGADLRWRGVDVISVILIWSVR